MSVQLSPGVRAQIQIKDEKDDARYYQEAFSSEEELKAFIEKNGRSKPGYSLLSSAFFPVGGKNIQNFTKNLLLPSFVNFALQINNVGLKIIVCFVAIFFDFAILPFRLATLPFSVYNQCKHPEKNHPLILLLKENSKNAIKKPSVVRLFYTVDIVQMDNPSVPDQENNVFQKAARQIRTGVIRVALKKVPGGIRNYSAEEEKNVTYLGMNGDFTEETSSLHRRACSSYSF